MARVYARTMTDRDQRHARLWRVVGWVAAAIAIVVVAGPQILDLVGS
jgi:hypothetical protein